MPCPKWPSAQPTSTVVQRPSGKLWCLQIQYCGSYQYPLLSNTILVLAMLNPSNRECIAPATTIVRKLKSRWRRCYKTALSNPVLVQSSSVLVRKADKILWLCIDYWNLNKASCFLLPHIQDTLNTLYGINLFTALDLLKGYQQIEVEESSRVKKAFTKHVGLFQYICLPFGLTNAPASC